MVEMLVPFPIAVFLDRKFVEEVVHLPEAKCGGDGLS